MSTTRSNREESRRRRKKFNFDDSGHFAVNPALLDTDTYVYRWFNDEQNGRISMKTKFDDWDLVPNAGEKEDSTDLGAMVSIFVGRNPDGSPKRAFLARKLKTYYDEDRAEQQARLDSQLAELRRGNTSDNQVQSDYIPSSGIRISR